MVAWYTVSSGTYTCVLQYWYTCTLEHSSVLGYCAICMYGTVWTGTNGHTYTYTCTWTTWTGTGTYGTRIRIDIAILEYATGTVWPYTHQDTDRYISIHAIFIKKETTMNQGDWQRQTNEQTVAIALASIQQLHWAVGTSICTGMTLGMDNRNWYGK